MDKLCNLTVELHDTGLVDDVVLGAATFKVSLQTLYPAGACGFFDLVPPGGRPGLWKEHANSYAVCELSFAPQYHPTAPSCLLTSLFADPCPLVSQQALSGAFGAEPSTMEIGGPAVQGGGHVVEGHAVQQPSEASEVLLVQGTPVRKADPTKAPSPHKADPPKAPSPQLEAEGPATGSTTRDLVTQCLHELSVNPDIWHRPEWTGYDSIDSSLQQGNAALAWSEVIHSRSKVSHLALSIASLLMVKATFICLAHGSRLKQCVLPRW